MIASAAAVALLALAAMAGEATARSSGEAAPASPREPGGACRDVVRPQDAAARATEFLAALAAWRAGDEGAGPRLDAAAHAMATLDGRADARRVAAHYLALSPEDRRVGLALEARYEALRDGWVEHDELAADGLAPPFEALAVPLELALEALLVDARVARDVAPLARAEALLARLTLARVEASDAQLDAASAPAPRVDDGSARLTRAEALARESERRFDDAGFATPRLEPLWLVGRLARARGAVAESRAAFFTAAQLAREVGQDMWRERALLGLLALERDAGDPRAARAVIDELATFRDPRTCWALAREHAADLLHQDRAVEARVFLARHRPDAGALDAPGSVAEDEPDELELAVALDEWRALRAAAALREGDVPAASAFVAELDSRTEHGALAAAQLALRLGRPAEARDALAAALATTRWSTAGRTMARVVVGEAWLADGRPDDAARELTAALGAARAWETERASRAGSVLGEWIGLHAVALLARAELERGAALEAARIALTWQARALRPGREEVTAEELVREAARESLGLVTYVVGPDFTVALHVDPTGEASGEVVPRGRAAIERGVNRLRQAITASDAGGAAALGAELAGALLPHRLRAALAQRVAERAGGASARASLSREGLVFVAHGPLERAPLGALAVAGEPLVGLEALRVLPGWPADCPVAPLGEGGTKPRWVLAGDPCAGATGASSDGADASHAGGDEAPGAAHEPRLSGAARELEELRALVPIERALVGPGFTRDALAAALTGTAPLHIATHLAPSPTPLEDARRGSPPVGLLCSNREVLTADAIAARAPRLPLVVLAACATGDGELLDGEGALGLARTFLVAGTRGLVVTSWPVDDGAAREFSLAFHAELARGVAPSRATARAARALRDAGRAARDWAAYRFVGRD